MIDYNDFLKSKAVVDPDTGFDPTEPLNPMLYDFQADLVRWALRRGRAALFCDCGLGKTPMQLEWARHVPGNVLILAPLAVAHQTIREGEKFGIECEYARKQDETNGAKITVTNYALQPGEIQRRRFG
jgi:superfamily II DNA or RNA helicase